MLERHSQTLIAGAHVLKRFTMVSSLSSALPLDSPLFSNLFFISSCILMPGVGKHKSGGPRHPFFC